MLKYGKKYQEMDADHYDRMHRNRVLANLKKKAAEFGCELIAVGQ